MTQQTFADYLYATRQAVSKRAQIVLITLAFMCSLVLSVIYLSNYFIQDTLVIESWSETIKCILLTLVLGYGTYAALYDRLNPKVATIISALYFGTAILTGIIGFVWLETGFMTEIPTEIYRDVFMLHTFALMENFLVLALLISMAYALHMKRKLAAR